MAISALLLHNLYSAVGAAKVAAAKSVCAEAVDRAVYETCSGLNGNLIKSGQTALCSLSSNIVSLIPIRFGEIAARGAKLHIGAISGLRALALCGKEFNVKLSYDCHAECVMEWRGNGEFLVLYSVVDCVVYPNGLSERMFAASYEIPVLSVKIQ